MRSLSLFWGLLSVVLMSCSQAVDIHRGDVEGSAADVRSAQKGDDGEERILALNPTVSRVMDDALAKNVFFYQSRHELFTAQLMVQYQEGDAGEFRVFLDDNEYLSDIELTHDQSVPCQADVPDEIRADTEMPFEGYIEYIGAYPRDGAVQHVVYEINRDREGSDTVPNLIEVIFEREVDTWMPRAVRLTDTDVSKVVCFFP